jgi:molybdate transport system regulatory protein
VAKLSIRVDIDGQGRLGPGKIELLEQLDARGSISAAGRAMRMSYKRAWDLVAELNEMFREPVVTSQTGGKDGGGARLTAFGRSVVDSYRAVEKACLEASDAHLRAIQKAARPKPD